MRTLRRSRRASVALVCAATLLASCHGSSKHASPTTGAPTTDKQGKVTVSLALRLGRVSVQAVGPVHAYTKPQQQVILGLVNRYVANAITSPLVTGHAAGPLLASFSPTLAGRVGPKGRDRGALSDVGIPKLTSVTKTVKQPLNLVVLQQNGTVLMVGAQFALTVQGATDDGQLSVARAGNFILEPDAKRHWHITGYTIVVRRNLGSTTTTTKATTTTAAR
ncbi:MAG TPA: hypothetical protein VH914_06210 [Acidimicrobiia bacterium]|jgi:hypothetical protein|nr:hypothetical protein [Acidimicrobiia bacterium]